VTRAPVRRSSYRKPHWNPARGCDRYHRSMTDQSDVRRIALSLPETSVDPEGFAVRVNGRAFAWEWMERVDPKRARVPNSDLFEVELALDGAQRLIIDLAGVAQLDDRGALRIDHPQLNLLVLQALLAPLIGLPRILRREMSLAVQEARLEP